jgi:hypothetical protein
VRFGDLVLEAAGDITIGDTRLPSGIRIEDCSLGTGPDRAILSRTPEGRVTLRHQGETRTFVWDEDQGQWFGPPPARSPSDTEGQSPQPQSQPESRSRSLPLPFGLETRPRVVLAAGVVVVLFWALFRPGSEATTTSTTTPTHDRSVAVARAGDPAPVGSLDRQSDTGTSTAIEPFTAVVDEFEAQLELDRMRREVLPIAADQEERLVDFFTIQAQAAEWLENEMYPFDTRKDDVVSRLEDTSHGTQLPFELRRRIARLTAPEIAMASSRFIGGERGIDAVRFRAQGLAGEVLRGDGALTLADAYQALRDQDVLEAAWTHMKTHHEQWDALYRDLPPAYQRSRQDEAADEIARLFRTPEPINRPGPGSEVDFAEDGFLGEGRFTPDPTIPARFERIARALAEGRREAETLFGPYFRAEEPPAGVTPR